MNLRRQRQATTPTATMASMMPAPAKPLPRETVDEFPLSRKIILGGTADVEPDAEADDELEWVVVGEALGERDAETLDELEGVVVGEALGERDAVMLDELEGVVVGVDEREADGLGDGLGELGTHFATRKTDTSAATVKLPPAYTSEPDTASASTLLFGPNPRPFHVVPSHLAMFDCAEKNELPAYTSEPDTASAFTPTDLPEPRACHAVPSHLAMLEADTPPADENKPPAYTSEPDTANAKT